MFAYRRLDPVGSPCSSCGTTVKIISPLPSRQTWSGKSRSSKILSCTPTKWFLFFVVAVTRKREKEPKSAFVATYIVYHICRYRHVFQNSRTSCYCNEIEIPLAHSSHSHCWTPLVRLPPQQPTGPRSLPRAIGRPRLDPPRRERNTNHVGSVLAL